MSNLYIKLWPDILQDPKMGKLTNSAFRVCINLFLLCNEQPENDGSLPSVSDIAWILRTDEDALANALHELDGAGIISWRNNHPFVINYAKRQAAVTDRERKRISRAKKAKESLASTKPAGIPEVSHGDVTSGSQVGHDDVTKRDPNKSKANKSKANKSKANKSKANKSKANKSKANESKANESKANETHEDAPTPPSSHPAYDSSLRFQSYDVSIWGFGPKFDDIWPLAVALQRFCNVPKPETFENDLWFLIEWGDRAPTATKIEQLAKDLRIQSTDGYVWPKNVFSAWENELKGGGSYKPASEPTEAELAEIDRKNLEQINKFVGAA